jgi:hypothetical protein
VTVAVLEVEPEDVAGGPRLRAAVAAGRPGTLRPSTPSATGVLLAVAVHGDAALTVLVPRFTAAPGPTGRGGPQERGLPWGGGGSGFTDDGAGSGGGCY